MAKPKFIKFQVVEKVASDARLTGTEAYFVDGQIVRITRGEYPEQTFIQTTCSMVAVQGSLETVMAHLESLGYKVDDGK